MIERERKCACVCGCVEFQAGPQNSTQGGCHRSNHFSLGRGIVPLKRSNEGKKTDSRSNLKVGIGSSAASRVKVFKVHEDLAWNRTLERWDGAKFSTLNLTTPSTVNI